jgi:SAM-dependent methyltransferase
MWLAKLFPSVRRLQARLAELEAITAIAPPRRSTQAPDSGFEFKGRPRKIDLGCGSNRRDGFIGVDVNYHGPMVDCVCNLNFDPLPFPDDSIEYVYSSHTFEHLKHWPHALQEIARVCKQDATVEIWTPFGRSDEAFMLGHEVFLVEQHWHNICYAWPELFLGKRSERLIWTEARYCLKPNILDKLNTIGIPLTVGLEVLFNIVSEWAVLLRVDKTGCSREIVPPRRLFSYSRDGEVIKEL